MTYRITGTDFCTARHYANSIANECTAAYWREAMHQADVLSHCDEIIKNMRLLADLFGFDLVEMEVDKSGKMAAARAREMNAELPAETLAVLKIKGMVS